MMSCITKHATRPTTHPYAPSLASSASTSPSSIFSYATSVSSAASSIRSFNGSDQGSVDSVQISLGMKDGNHHSHPVPVRAQSALPAQQRLHPRRTARPPDGSNTSCVLEGCTMPVMPNLLREIERKVHFVDNLVDVAAQIVETIWPAYMKSESTGGKGVLPLRTFIQETLKRSRTSYSTLQVALYYLIIIRPYIGTPIPADLTAELAQRMRALQCGRRMFLAALILASKYLQDRNYSARAWSRISGLQTTEININEIAFLEAVRWQLYVSEPNFQHWTELVTIYATRTGKPEVDESIKQEWGQLILRLSPDLREGMPIIEMKKGKTEASSQAMLEASGLSSPLSACESFGARITPRAAPAVAVGPAPKVSSLLAHGFAVNQNPPSRFELQSEAPALKPAPQCVRLTSISDSSPLRAPAARPCVGISAMACAAATAQIGQLQRCTTENINNCSRRATLQKRSCLSASISSSPEMVGYSDSSTNSSPSRFPLSRSSSISSASSVDSIIPSKIAAQSVAGKKFSRVSISSNEPILVAESAASLGINTLAEISLGVKLVSELNTPTPSSQKNLVLRLKPTLATSSPVCCPRKRQRGREHESTIDMESNVAKTTSGLTPHLQAQLQMQVPADGTGFKRLRCATQEAMLSIHAYRGNEEVS